MKKNHSITLKTQPYQGDSLRSFTNKDIPSVDSFASRAKGKTGLSRIIKAAGYSLDGFRAAYKFEAAFRQVLWLNLILLLALVSLPFAISIKMLLIIASFLSLIVELINTGIEACVDHTSTAKHPLAKIAKDVGSAAQFLSLLLLFILWALALSSFYTEPFLSFYK